jgi:hypothetical protein
MADLDTELADLLSSVAEADRPAMREMLTRNPSAASLLTSRETVYKAFVDGDPTKLAAATAAVSANPNPANPANPNPAANANPAQTNPVSLGLDQINALLTEKVKGVYTSPEFAAAVAVEAEKKAKTLFESERANVIGRSAEISDTITSIRESHLREFSEPLDSAAFKEFYAKEGPKYGNDLQGSYNAYVSEKRTAKKIADGIAAGLAARATADVPGSTVPTTNNSLGPNFVDHNMKVISPAGTAAPSVDADKAAQAFASMRQGWTQ